MTKKNNFAVAVFSLILVRKWRSSEDPCDETRIRNRNSGGKASSTAHTTYNQIK